MMTLWVTAMSDATTKFDPYYLQIWIKPYQILVDLGLMVPLDNSSYAALTAQDPELKAKCEMKKFVYYVLGPKLVHCSTEGQFAYFEVLNLHHKLTGVVVDWQSKLKPFEYRDGMDFFFQLAPDRRSYEFGVRLSKDWWDEHRMKAAVSPDLKKLDARCNGDLILVLYLAREALDIAWSFVMMLIGLGGMAYIAGPKLTLSSVVSSELPCLAGGWAETSFVCGVRCAILCTTTQR
jgi:hypothetical protein